MPIDDVVIRERLAATFHAVADQTTVDDRLVDARRAKVVPADTARRSRRWPAVLVAAAACVALLTLVVVFDDDGDQSLDTISPTSVTADPAETVSGTDAYVIPPTAIGAIPLMAIHGSGGRVTGDGEDVESWFRRETDIGEWRVDWEEFSATSSVIYRYSSDEQIEGPPDVWIGTTAPARLDLDDVTDGSGSGPSRIEGPDGVDFVDLGVVCPAGENLVASMLGSPGRSCARRAIGVGDEFVVELVLPVETDLNSLLAQLRVGTLDDLRDALPPVDGLDRLGVPIKWPDEVLPPPPTHPSAMLGTTSSHCLETGHRPTTPP